MLRTFGFFGAAGGTWTPLSLGSKLLAFYDPRGGSPNNDLSGNGYNLSSVTGTVSIDSNAFGTGKPGFNFDGTCGFMVSSFAQGGGSVLGAASVFTLTSGAANNIRLAAYADPAQFQDYDNVTSGILIARDVGNANVQGYRNNTALSTGSISYGARTRAISEFDGTNHTLRLNGTDQTSVASTGSFVSSGKLFYGCSREDITDGVNRWVGKGGPLVVWNAALTSGEKSSLDAWLAAWNV